MVTLYEIYNFTFHNMLIFGTQLSSAHEFYFLEKRFLYLRSAPSEAGDSLENRAEAIDGKVESVEEIVKNDLNALKQAVKKSIIPKNAELFDAALEKANSLDDIEKAVDVYAESVEKAIDLAEDRNKAVIDLIEGDLLSDSEKQELYGTQNSNISKLFAAAQKQVQALINIKEKYDISADVFDEKILLEIESELKEKMRKNLEEKYNEMTEDIDSIQSADFDEIGEFLAKYNINDPSILLGHIQLKRDSVYQQAKNPDIARIFSGIKNGQQKLQGFKASLNGIIDSALKQEVAVADSIKLDILNAERKEVVDIVGKFNAENESVLLQKQKIDAEIQDLSGKLLSQGQILQSTISSIVDSEKAIDNTDRKVDLAKDRYSRLRWDNDVYFNSEKGIEKELAYEMQKDLNDTSNLLKDYQRSNFRTRINIENRLKEKHNINIGTLNDAKKVYSDLYKKYKLLQNNPSRVDEYKVVLEKIQNAKNALDAAKKEYKQSEKMLSDLEVGKKVLQKNIDAYQTQIKKLVVKKESIHMSYEKGFWNTVSSWFSSPDSTNTIDDNEDYNF